MDTASFGRAMRRVLRQDPDVILIGEMRDEETVRAALSAAETGHLVLSTVHTLDASESINRILDFFPPHQHNQARSMIAGTLKGVISQRLVRSSDGGRVAVCEILRMTGRVRDMIKDPAQMGKLGDVIFTGGYYGMQTFDQALFKHVKAGRVSFEDALGSASSPHDFKLLVEADGKRGTTMEDVAEAHAQAEGNGAAPPPPSTVIPVAAAPGPPPSAPVPVAAAPGPPPSTAVPAAAAPGPPPPPAEVALPLAGGPPPPLPVPQPAQVAAMTAGVNGGGPPPPIQ
jgi:twitching motility protein PilT